MSCPPPCTRGIADPCDTCMEESLAVDDFLLSLNIRAGKHLDPRLPSWRAAAENA